MVNNVILNKNSINKYFKIFVFHVIINKIGKKIIEASLSKIGASFVSINWSTLIACADCKHNNIVNKLIKILLIIYSLFLCLLV